MAEIVKQRELRVLQVFDSLGVGGAETWLMSLLKYFREANDSLPLRVNTHICLTSGASAVFDEQAKSLGASLHYLRYYRRRLPAFARQFRRVLAIGNYHAIHDHQGYTAGIHFLLGLGQLPPVRIAHVHNPAYQLHEHNADWASRTAKRYGKWLVSRLATSIAGTSARILREYGYGPELASHRARAVYCGFDVSRFTGDEKKHRAELRDELRWPADAKIVLFVGRLGGEELAVGGRSHKNPLFALEVVAKCIAAEPNVRLAYVGQNGEMRPVLEGRIHELNLVDQVRFLGLRSDVPHLMLAADALLFPSSAEGLGMVTVEAQAAGLPILASSSTPDECVVVPALVEFLSLDASPFSIENSARAVLSLYTAGRSDFAVGD